MMAMSVPRTEPGTDRITLPLSDASRSVALRETVKGNAILQLQMRTKFLQCSDASGLLHLFLCTCFAELHALSLNTQ